MAGAEHFRGDETTVVNRFPHDYTAYGLHVHSPIALPAFPVTRLLPDAVHALGWRDRTRGRVHEATEKHLAPVERFRATPLAVRAVCVLASHDRDGIEVEPLRVSAAFRQMWDFTYRRAFLHGLGQRPAHVRTVVTMAKQVPVAWLVRPVHPFRLDALADRVEELLAGGVCFGPERCAVRVRRRRFSATAAEEEGCP